MSFFSFLEKLQNKPEHKKRKILMFSTIILTSLVFVFWMYFIFNGIASINDEENKKEDYIEINTQFNNLFLFTTGVFQDIEVGAKTLKDNILSITDYGKEK